MKFGEPKFNLVNRSLEWGKEAENWAKRRAKEKKRKTRERFCSGRKGLI